MLCIWKRNKGVFSFIFHLQFRWPIGPNFHRFVILFICWDTPSEKTGFDNHSAIKLEKCFPWEMLIRLSTEVLTYLDVSSRLNSFISVGMILVASSPGPYCLGSWPLNSDSMNCNLQLKLNGWILVQNCVFPWMSPCRPKKQDQNNVSRVSMVLCFDA